QQDGIEQHMDFDNRYTLLELFAETTSSEEHGISFEGIHLPQIPGKLLFSLVKRYLCVTSLMDKLNTAGVESTSERQDVGPSSSTAAYQSEHARVQREFEFTMAMANLISELVRVMGWDRNRQLPLTSTRASRGVEEINNEIQKHTVRSIFQPRFSASSSFMATTAMAAVTPPKKKKTANGFKTRSDFTSRSAYVEYVQDNLKSGMMVRMLEDYEEVSAGDEGEFRYSNDGSPPVQVSAVSCLGLFMLSFPLSPGIFQMVELDESTLIQLSLSSEVARKVLHYLKQNLQASCLGDLHCSHTFTKHYLNCGGASLEDEEMLMDSSLGGQGASSSSSLSSATASSSSSASSCTMGSVSKKAKKEIPADTVLKMLVEMIGSQPKQNAVTALLLTRSLMLKYEWRVSFATEGGVKAILSCMQEYTTCIQVQQIALATLKVITGASKHDPRSVGGCLPLSESGTQMMLEIFASIGSATPEGSKGLLCTIPSAIDLMLSTAGCGLSVRNGLLVIIMLISSHKSLAEQLVACNVSATLKKCLSAQNQHSMLAIIALNHISMVHKLEKKDEHDFKDTELKMLVVSLKEMPATKEVILTLEQLLCDDASQLEEERSEVTRSRDTFQDLIRLMDQHRADRAAQLSILRILNKFLDNYQEDLLPWHESIEPCLSSMTAFVSDREVVQQFIRFLYRLASLNKDYAVVMCRLGTKEALIKAVDKHSTSLLMVTELRDLINDCEKYASLYKKMTTSVLAGCIQMVLGQIEEHRRSHQPINIPFFDVFLRNLCQGSSVELKEDKCWEKVEVSSNHHRANKLTDKNPKTYWESNGCTGSHFINIYMHKGVIIRYAGLSTLYLVNAAKINSRLSLQQQLIGAGNECLIIKLKGPKNPLNYLLFHSQHMAFWLDLNQIKSITISGNHPLSWLMSEYLENTESSKRCKSSASIFNSRVRRLTHLLVHVDTSTVDTEELKPPIKSSESVSSSSSSSKPKVKNTSSIAGIALCWQGVVQRQVKSFLDSTCSLPDFVELYRGLFLRLKNAMEELFGQHTAFVLALRQGFSAALLQLSILTAMHVSERFAQYIDKMIQESGVDSGNVDTLNQLQQFLEPMLFLSGLELANTFEHFYRYYMGDRLLGQGKVWLESAVVEQIGTCFPNRFPQQMLTNLSESEELQQEFHLYRLQQLDKNLENFEEGESDVKVLVLSPRCWVVSAPCYLEDPSKHFPAQLCNYLAEFTDFYANGQRMYGLTHSKPRRLQWTWLGHAELQYGSCTLCVSTLQMYILLQFNKHEDVNVEMLQQATGLSPAMLSHALKPLTAEKGILTHTRVLRLNKKTLSQSSDRHGYHFLLPKQTYLNVDEDAALTLERKRNYIYCLVVQIMKNEKEMHIDNLVFMVLDRCQKQESSRTRASVRFSCSTTDVLSCIMHVINKGYLRRNEESPHIVEFLMEDPSTPQKGQAQFSFKMDVKKSSASSSGGSKDGVLEAVLFSMGRTMTQEEVKQLMQRTVQQVAGTLSLDLDRAEHLLMHCKWNVDLLIQRYTDDPDALVLAAGLKIRNPQPAPGPVAQCPVCLSQSKESDPPPMLCCMHYCCRSCWQEYLTARIEQNLVMNCDCPITDCRAQPTSKFFHNILTDKDTIAKYDSALLRGFVECCSNLTWCTNPQGCDQILCKENIGSVGTCSKCCWSSCFSCNFPEAHYPASCSHMSQWMDDGGYYEGMSMEAQSKHLAKLISKRCPSCQAQIEKNEGCLHMTCAKCNHGFCWRCLKPWKPTHKDYYNCSAMVSVFRRCGGFCE
uniref:Cullin 7 n=1 Tax=Sinocyclocheilus rhinocerous TaxID=307959 RepID=A0A673KXK3_9TELE